MRKVHKAQGVVCYNGGIEFREALCGADGKLVHEIRCLYDNKDVTCKRCKRIMEKNNAR